MLVAHALVCLFQIDNERLGEVDSFGCLAYVLSNSGMWNRRIDISGATIDEEGGVVGRFNRSLASGLEARLVDFDDHLDDSRNDWLNASLPL